MDWTTLVFTHIAAAAAGACVAVVLLAIVAGRDFSTPQDPD